VLEKGLDPKERIIREGVRQVRDGDKVEVEFHKPERARDLFWRPAHMVVTDGPDGVVYLPALYHGTHTFSDEAVKLGRGTHWDGGDGLPYVGRGLREYLVGDAAKTILEIDTVQFTRK
ncbi:MAG: hypothetical protein K2P78_12385, partial [Gemmataceae bacterium]|nr:hypothetical protein [Gemmataceae bacterium]